MDVAFGRGLNAETAAMDATCEFDVEALLDWLEEIHDEVVSDVKSAKRQDVFVVGPLASDHFDIETFLFEEAFFDSGENGRFAGEADVADADFGGAGGICGGIGGFVATCEQKGA